MMQRLTKLSTNENKLRTNEVLGEGMGEPTVGRSFTFVGEALDKSVGDTRFVTTSIVTEILKNENGAVEFKTLNSTYRVENLN